jgi:hypothetical protein
MGKTIWPRAISERLISWDKVARGLGDIAEMD